MLLVSAVSVPSLSSQWVYELYNLSLFAGSVYSAMLGVISDKFAPKEMYFYFSSIYLVFKRLLSFLVNIRQLLFLFAIWTFLLPHIICCQKCFVGDLILAVHPGC